MSFVDYVAKIIFLFFELESCEHLQESFTPRIRDTGIRNINPKLKHWKFLKLIEDFSHSKNSIKSAETKKRPFLNVPK